MDCIGVKERQLLIKIMAKLISKWKRIKPLRQQVTKHRQLDKHKILAYGSLMCEREAQLLTLDFSLEMLYSALMTSFQHHK